MNNRSVIIVSGGVASYYKDAGVKVNIIDLDNAEQGDLIRIVGYEDLIPDYIKDRYMSKPKGADIEIQFGDNATGVLYRYASFGQYIEDDDCDSFCIQDHEIFFYFENEEELKVHTVKHASREFTIINYNLVY